MVLVLKKAVVIGSGIAGLSAAIRLANKGYDVSVYESNSEVGGKLSQLALGKYRFDCGPSLFTMPELFEELFDECKKNFSDYLKYKKLDTITNYFYEDGTRFKSYSSNEKFAQELHRLALIEEKTVIEYLNKSRKSYKLTKHVFLENSLHKMKTFLNLKTLISLIQLYKLPLFGSLNSFNKKKIENPKIVQYFNRFATYNGSNPYKAPSLLSLIPHLEHNIGAFYPTGGMFQIAMSLKKLANDLGVKFEFNCKVTEIIIEGNRAIGINVNSEFIATDAVFSNMDIYQTYKKLLPNLIMPNNVKYEEKSSSGIVFFWGIKKEFKELGLHNIFFASNYEEEFHKIFNEYSISEDPTIYINITSKYSIEDAPLNCENWFVMINAPHNDGTQDWDLMVEKARKNIVHKLNRILKVNIEDFIEVESVLDPRKIEINTSSFGGSLYGSASNSKWAAFLRHKNFSNKVRNLYFCGGSVHPGGGIPLAMLSGKIAVDCLVD